MGAFHARDAAECELHSLGPRARSPHAAQEIDRDELGPRVEAVLVGFAAETEHSAEPEDEQQESLHDPWLHDPWTVRGRSAAPRGYFPARGAATAMVERGLTPGRRGTSILDLT